MIQGPRALVLCLPIALGAFPIKTFSLLSSSTLATGHKLNFFPTNKVILRADEPLAPPKKGAFLLPCQTTPSPKWNAARMSSVEMRLRGGSSSTDDNSSDDISSNDSDDESDTDTTVKKSPTPQKLYETDDIFIRVEAELESPNDGQTQKRHDIGSTFNIPSLLWMSLAFDALLNKKKRALLFVTASGSGALTLSTLGPAVSLAAGYLLSSVLFYILSTDYFTEVSVDNDYRDGVFRKMTLLLALFGAVNLPGHLYAEQPFLGMGGAAIHGHNVLMAINGWMKGVALKMRSAGDSNRGGGKEVMINELVSSVKSGIARLSPRGLVPPSNVSVARGMVSMGYLLVAYGAIVNCAMKALAFLTPSTISSKPLQWASMARLILVSGLATSLKEASDRGFLSDVFFRMVNGLLSVCSMAVGLSCIVTSVTGNSPYSMLEIVSPILFSIFTAFNYFVSLDKKTEVVVG